jgi:hypothetical protein
MDQYSCWEPRLANPFNLVVFARLEPLAQGKPPLR